MANFSIQEQPISSFTSSSILDPCISLLFSPFPCQFTCQLHKMLENGTYFLVTLKSRSKGALPNVLLDEQYCRNFYKRQASTPGLYFIGTIFYYPSASCTENIASLHSTGVHAIPLMNEHDFLLSICLIHRKHCQPSFYRCACHPAHE